jgi:phospholipase C
VQLANVTEPANCGFCKVQSCTSSFNESYRLHCEKEYSKKAPSTNASAASSYKEEQIRAMGDGFFAVVDVVLLFSLFPAHLAKSYACSDEYFAGLAGPTVPNRMLFLSCATPQDSHHNPEGGAQLLEYIRGMKSVPTIFNRLENARFVFCSRSRFSFCS